MDSQNGQGICYCRWSDFVRLDHQLKRISPRNVRCLPEMTGTVQHAAVLVNSDYSQTLPKAYVEQMQISWLCIVPSVRDGQDGGIIRQVC